MAKTEEDDTKKRRSSPPRPPSAAASPMIRLQPACANERNYHDFFRDATVDEIAQVDGASSHIVVTASRTRLTFGGDV